MMKIDLHKKQGIQRPASEAAQKGPRGTRKGYCQSLPHAAQALVPYIHVHEHPYRGMGLPALSGLWKKREPAAGFAKAYLVYKLVFLAAALIILGILVYIGLDLADKLLAYMEML